MFKRLLNWLKLGETTVSTLTAWIKFLIVAGGLFAGGYKVSKKLVFNSWARRNMEETRFVNDSIMDIQLMQKYDRLELKVDSLRQDVKDMKGTQVASVKAINRHLDNEKKVQERLMFEIDQNEALKKND